MKKMSLHTLMKNGKKKKTTLSIKKIMKEQPIKEFL